MVEPTWTAQLLGSTLSSLTGVVVGVVLFLFKSNYDELIEQKNWHQETWRLAKQVEELTPSEPPPNQRGHLIESIDTIRRRLRDKSLNAHYAADDEVVENVNKLSELCISGRDTLIDGSDSNGETLEELRTVSHDLAEEAKKAEQKIGLVFNPSLRDRLDP